MRRALLAAILLVALVGLVTGVSLAQPVEHQNEDVNEQPRAGARFGYVDLFVDSGEDTLGAYQLEFRPVGGGVKIVGIEGGEHEAFADAPYYDPRALKDGERVVIGAFSTDKDLPSGRTRVARVHVQIEIADPTFETTLQASADGGGTPLQSTIDMTEMIP